MKKFIIIFTFFIFLQAVNAETFEAGITINQVPKSLYGNWRILAKLDSTNSPKLFRGQTLDFWNLYRDDSVIILENPLSGANAEVLFETIEDNIIVFTKKTHYDKNKLLTDTVRIRLNGNNFSGINTLKLETFSLIDNRLIKTQTANYHIKGEKISGESFINEETAPAESIFP